MQNHRPPCSCDAATHEKRLVVITGGPGAGKTALLEMIRRNFCEHVAVLPESASILFGGGFPRHRTESGRRAGQRAIFHVQRELERLTVEDSNVAVALCDRGTLDGAAYWPGDPADFWREVGTTHAAELARYTAVVHLRTPPASYYNRDNPLRIESAAEAARIDARIHDVWKDHPAHFEVPHAAHFLDKVLQAMGILREQIPACCRGNGAALGGDRK